jgi:hypothetical protein
MAENPDLHRAEHEADAARSRVLSDIEALGERARDDRAAIQSRTQDSAAAIAGGAAALGLLIGLGGKKAVRALVGVGLAAGAVFYYVRQQQSQSAADAPGRGVDVPIATPRDSDA